MYVNEKGDRKDEKLRERKGQLWLMNEEEEDEAADVGHGLLN